MVSVQQNAFGSIHPQGWVPVETNPQVLQHHDHKTIRSIHPQGWVPVESARRAIALDENHARSIHPQGWVPVERFVMVMDMKAAVSHS